MDVILGCGKRLFDGFGSSLALEHLGVRQSQHATFITFRVKRHDGSRRTQKESWRDGATGAI